MGGANLPITDRVKNANANVELHGNTVAGAVVKTKGGFTTPTSRAPVPAPSATGDVAMSKAVRDLALATSVAKSHLLLAEAKRAMGKGR